MLFLRKKRTGVEILITTIEIKSRAIQKKEERGATEESRYGWCGWGEEAGWLPTLIKFPTSILLFLLIFESGGGTVLNFPPTPPTPRKTLTISCIVR